METIKPKEKLRNQIHDELEGVYWISTTHYWDRIDSKIDALKKVIKRYENETARVKKAQAKKLI